MYSNYFIFVLITIFLITGCAPDKSANVFTTGAPVDLTQPDLPDEGHDEKPDREAYIVVFKKSAVLKYSIAPGGLNTGDYLSQHKLMREHVLQLLNESSQQYKLPKASRVFSVALQGGVYHLSGVEARTLAQDQRVAYVEKDHFVKVNAVQNSNVPWGLDRIDQVSLPLNQIYTYANLGVQVNAYVIDTGIKTTHENFQGRAVSGYDFVDKDVDATDCNGHGTHVAGTIGGASYGVAKTVRLVGVRVLDCEGSGTYSNVIAGVEWVTANHIKPAVVNMSLGGPTSQALDDAVKASIQAGVTYVVAAGNENESACESSPSRLPEAISVGSTTNTDVRSSFSNYGSCVDIFAPGSDIKSAWYTSNTETKIISGTSMASPHVAGTVALYLMKNPAATPSEVSAAVVGGSVAGKISSVGAGSPNRLLNIAFVGTDDTSGGGGGGGNAPPNPPSLPSPPAPAPVDPDAPCTKCDRFRGELRSRGAYIYHPSDGDYYVSSAGVQKIWLKGPSNADFDIYLYKVERAKLVRVAASLKAKSVEAISYRGQAGQYVIKVVSYSGVGRYRLWRELP